MLRLQILQSIRYSLNHIVSVMCDFTTEVLYMSISICICAGDIQWYQAVPCMHAQRGMHRRSFSKADFTFVDSSTAEDYVVGQNNFLILMNWKFETFEYSI